MPMQVRVLPAVFCVVTLLSISSFAQTAERRQTNAPPQAQEQPPNLPPNANSVDTVANEIAQLRKSVQTLTTRLREISDKLPTPDANRSGSQNDKLDRISINLDILTRAEQRAELLRKELLDRMEKEVSLRSRLAQLDEDSRPENIERALNPYGTTRTVELRDNRRRVLDNDKRGFESLLNQTTYSRMKLEEDVKQADSLVVKLRQRVLPLLEREIEKINPNP